MNESETRKRVILEFPDRNLTLQLDTQDSFLNPSIPFIHVSENHTWISRSHGNQRYYNDRKYHKDRNYHGGWKNHSNDDGGKKCHYRGSVEGEEDSIVVLNACPRLVGGVGVGGSDEFGDRFGVEMGEVQRVRVVCGMGCGVGEDVMW